MREIARGTVYPGQEGTERQSCAFPAVCVLPGGRWLCAFRAAPTKGAATGQHVLLTWSDDGGRTWCDPVAPFRPLLREKRPGLFRACGLTALGDRRILAVLCWVDHSKPDLPFFNERTEGLLDTRICLASSDDSGESWSEPGWMDTGPFDMPVPITGPVLVLGNGDWACQFELNKHYDDPAPWRHASVLLFSRDGGRTWPEHVLTSGDPSNRIYYWDQRPSVLPDGRILDLFWTFDRVTATYLNIHARDSRDHGRTWSDIRDTGVPGQPAAPFWLPGGRIGMVYVDRTGEPTIRLRTSDDNGRHWPVSSERTIYRGGGQPAAGTRRDMKDAWAEMGRFSVGLPATAVTPEGRVLVVYYVGPTTDRTGIDWVLVDGGEPAA